MTNHLLRKPGNIMKDPARRFALIAFMASVLAIGNVFADTESGLIALYSFNGNATDSIGGNDASVTNSTLTEDRFGNPDGAYLLNGISTLSGGGSYLQLSHNFDFVGMGGSITLSAWVKTSDSSGFIFHQANGGQIALKTSGGYASFFTHMSDGNWYSATDTTPFALDTWINITGVYHANDKNELWVNGDLVSSISLPTANLFDVTWSDYFYAGIGAYRESWYPDTLNDPFAGIIDEFRVYNRALTPEEIEELATIPEPSAPLLIGIALATLAASRRMTGTRGISLHVIRSPKTGQRSV